MSCSETETDSLTVKYDFYACIVCAPTTVTSKVDQIFSICYMFH